VPVVLSLVGGIVVLAGVVIVNTKGRGVVVSSRR
jgi:hypothetical protein